MSSLEGDKSVDAVHPGNFADHPASAALQYERLRGELTGWQHPPGTLLLETSLSRRFGVSRTPVREALARLEQEGLLERVQRGYRVRVISTDEIVEIYEVRTVLEATAAAAVAERRSALDLARLEYLHQQIADADPADRPRLNQDFHREMARAGRNRFLERSIDQMIAMLSMWDPKTTPANGEIIVHEHAEILTAIQERDADAAHDAMTRHLTRTRDARIAVLVKRDRERTGS